LGKDAVDLEVDVLRAGVFAADLVADRRFVAAISHARDGYLIADIHVGVIKGMGGQPVRRQCGQLGVQGRRIEVGLSWR